MQTPDQVAGEAREKLAKALAYFRPHPTSHGAIMLTPEKMREHLAVIEAALRAQPERGAEEMRELPKSDFRQGRKVARNVYHGEEPLFMAATDELAVELLTILNAGAAAIRALPLHPAKDEGGGR